MPNQSNQTQPTSCPAPKEGSFRTTIGGQAYMTVIDGKVVYRAE